VEGLGLLLDRFCILQPRHLEVAAQLFCMYMASYFVNNYSVMIAVRMNYATPVI
jgi:hypothetical protein